MPRFSASLGFLWPELNLVERIAAARDNGFEAVEFHWPYDVPAERVTEALARSGLPALSLNTLPGDLDAGEFGLAAIPGRLEQARRDIDSALSYAATIGARDVHLMAGCSGEDDAALNVFMDNLDYAACRASPLGIGILIEPMNHRDRPGYLVQRVGQAVEIVNAVKSRFGHDNLGIIFDCYHTGITEGNLERLLSQHLHAIRHIQIASVPDRAEPDHGEIDYGRLFDDLDDLGYDGFVGAEYIPATTTEAGLDWLRRWHRKRKI